MVTPRVFRTFVPLRMKSFLFILIPLFLCAGLASAQQSILGVRQGIGLWLNKRGIGQGSLIYAEDQHLTWNKEVFYRNVIRQKWSYETSLSYFSFNNVRKGKRYASRTERNEVLKTSFSVQYDVTYPLMAYMFPFLRHARSYIGFNAAPMISFDRYNTVALDGSETKENRQHIMMMVGFSYTHIIPVSKRLNITSVLSFQTNAFYKYTINPDHELPNKSISWMGGLGYRL